MNERQIKKAKPQSEQVFSNNVFDRLSTDVMIDILCRLPITSIVQFFLTSCSSLSLSRNQDLVNSHLLRAFQESPCVILHSDYPLKNQLHFLNFSDEKVRKIDIPFASSMPEFKIVGSCNGLLCLVNTLLPGSIYLFNPFAIKPGRYREIPNNYAFKKQAVVYGFGFDSLNNDYKLVMIADKTSKHNNVPKGQVSKSQIYSLRENAWKKGGIIPLRLEKVRASPGVSVNGKLHWVSKYSRCNNRLTDRVIVSYDLSNDTFDVIGKPGAAARWVHCHLTALDGCISVCSTDRPGHGTLDIWVMKTYGVIRSWEKIYHIRSYIPISLMSYRLSRYNPLWHNMFKQKKWVRLLGVRKSGEVVMEYTGGGLISYDPVKNSFTPLRFRGMPELYEATVHVYTLKSAASPF